MDRRVFLKSGTATLGAAALSATVGRPSAAFAGTRPPAETGDIMTVTGPVAPENLGRALPHEHVLVDFVGWEEAGPHRYDRSEVERVVRPHLEVLADAGGDTLFECTPAYLGRDPALLRALSTVTGVQIVTNTGYYGARDDQHVPEHAYSDSVDALAQRWIAEWHNGIGDTGIRPGFIKIGVDAGPLSDIDEKLVRAACRTHLETGLTIASHTGPATPAFDQLEVLDDEGVDPSAWIWVHAQSEEDYSHHLEAARRGAWVEFDGYDPEQTDRYVRWLATMREEDLLDRVLLSHDNGWYSVGEPDGGEFQPYTALFTHLVPALRDDGFSADDIDTLLTRNPARAFAVQTRSAP